MCSFSFYDPKEDGRHIIMREESVQGMGEKRILNIKCNN